MASLLPRGLQPTIERAWSNAAVVVLEGLRATGKSTITRNLVSEGHFRNLNDSAERRRALDDPDGWLASLPIGAVIDEAQLVPELQLGIKQLLDVRGATVSQFLLTGSARFNTRELGGSDPLTGRVRRLRLHPFSQSEIERRPADAVTALFDDDPRLWSIPGCDHAEIIERASRGGFPTMRSLEPQERSRMLGDYVPALFDGSTHETKRDIVRIARFFRWLSGRSGSVRNIVDFASLNELARDTVQGYLEELAQVHLIETIAGYRPGHDQRETEKERIFVADPAFVAAGLPTDSALLMQNTDAFSSLLETFVANEIIRLLSWSATEATPFHWRESDAREVDLLLERRDGALIGIEVKAARTARDDHAAGLRELRKRHPKRFHRGFVFHSGVHVTRFEDDLWALPFSALWTIGHEVTKPTTSVAERIRIQTQYIRADDEARLAASRSQADRMSEAFDEVVAALEALRDALTGLDFAAKTMVSPATRWTAKAPPNDNDEIWQQTASTEIGESPRLGFTVTGTLTGNGNVTWTSKGIGDADVIQLDVTGDHKSAIADLFAPMIDQLPGIVAALRN
jgi:uncharacterized protein